MLDKATKKQMVQAYLEEKRPMGIIMIKNNKDNKICLLDTVDTRSMMNRLSFSLDAGAFKSRELQQDWKKLGPEHFTIEILELLKYEEDSDKTDYSRELKFAKEMWEEKLINEQGVTLYK